MSFVLQVTEENNPAIVLEAVKEIDLNAPGANKIIAPGRLIYFEFTPQDFEKSYYQMVALTKIGRLNMVIKFEKLAPVNISMHSIVAEYNEKTNVWSVKDGIHVS